MATSPVLTSRLMVRLNKLYKKPIPWFNTAVLKTALNAWVTDIRMKSHDCCSCRLGCGADVDSLEHCAVCQYMRARWHTLSSQTCSELDSFGLADDVLNIAIVRSGFLFCIYSIAMRARHCGPPNCLNAFIKQLEEKKRQAINLSAEFSKALAQVEKRRGNVGHAVFGQGSIIMNVRS